jgi:hypothetical protein
MSNADPYMLTVEALKFKTRSLPPLNTGAGRVRFGAGSSGGR